MSKEMYNSLQNINFDGASGEVVFNNATGTRKSTSSFMEIKNVLRTNTNNGKSDFKLVLSTALDPNEDGSNWTMNKVNPFVYADDSTTRPLDLPPVNGGKGVNMNYIGSLRFLGYILFGITALLAISFGFWTFFRRNARVVRASQPIFLIMISAGALTMSSAIISMSIDDEHFSPAGCTIACMATPWLLCLGFVFSFSALFSKTWRINKILNNPCRFQRVKVEAKDVMAPFVIFLVLNVAILTLWTVLAPREWVRSIDDNGTDQYNRPITSHGICTTSPNSRTSATPYYSLLMVLNFLLLMFTIYQAYRARHVSTDYSESKYITMCIASMLEAFIFGIPMFLVGDVNEYHLSTFLVGTLIVFVVSMAILLFMFVPKIIQCRKDIQTKKMREEMRENTANNTSCSHRGFGGLGFQIRKSAKLENGVVIEPSHEIPVHTIPGVKPTEDLERGLNGDTEGNSVRNVGTNIVGHISQSNKVTLRS